MRISSALLALFALAACNAAESDAAAGGEGADGGNRIECALGGAASFSRQCGVEQVELDGVRTLIVHHPDGGFRRFEVLTDGRGLALADGAEEAIAEVVDGRLEISVGSDRYRFPATIRGDDSGQ
jgi:hypothetical protein